jgi:hypothetical protein
MMDRSQNSHPYPPVFSAALAMFMKVGSQIHLDS